MQSSFGTPPPPSLQPYPYPTHLYVLHSTMLHQPWSNFRNLTFLDHASRSELENLGLRPLTEKTYIYIYIYIYTSLATLGPKLWTPNLKNPVLERGKKHKTCCRLPTIVGLCLFGKITQIVGEIEIRLRLRFLIGFWLTGFYLNMQIF